MEVKQRLSIFSPFLYYLCLNIYCLETVINKCERKSKEQTRMGNLETQETLLVKNMEVKQHLSIFSPFLYYLCLNIYCLESVISKRERKSMEQTRMGNLKTQATLGTQEWAI